MNFDQGRLLLSDGTIFIKKRRAFAEIFMNKPNSNKSEKHEGKME
jgi:hypothetical protein